MSDSFLLRKALTTTESPLLSAADSSYFFRTIRFCNVEVLPANLFLGIVSGRAVIEHGDWLIYHTPVDAHGYLVIENILLPMGSELRGYAGTADAISMIASGVFEGT